MPYSAAFGKAWTGRRLAQWEPSTVLDIGVGSGTYSRLFRQPDQHWTGVEIHEPYLERFGLADLYDAIDVVDVRELVWSPYDVVILGDVIEHMSYRDGLAVWEQARVNARHVVLSLPIVEWPQEACEGNEHERHVETYSHHRVLASFPGIQEWCLGAQVGVYTT